MLYYKDRKEINSMKKSKNGNEPIGSTYKYELLYYLLLFC